MAARTARDGALSSDGHTHPDENAHDHGHPHPGGPRFAWLLTLPAAALLLFPPPALGSYSAAREDTQRAAQGIGTFPALPAGDPVDLSVAAFTSRAIYDSGYSLKGRTVRLTGFVTQGDDGVWYVTRLLVSCTALAALVVSADRPSPQAATAPAGAVADDAAAAGRSGKGRRRKPHR
ncbi:hypothetical protein SALBM311S_06169 [Streptomyces alboniger]